MSGFAIPPLSSGLAFDISQFSGGMDKVTATAQSFPAMFASHFDAPLKQSADAMGHSVQEMSGHLDALKGKSEIHGHAEMDASGIQHGMMEAEATMQLFPAIVVEFIENPLLAAVAVGKEGFEKLAEFAKEAFEKIGDIVVETAKHFEDINLGAIKTGLSPEIFSTYAAAAKSCGVSVQEFTTSLDMLQDKAANAIRGDEGALKAFADLKINTDELQKLVNDPKAFLDTVAHAYEGMTTQAQKIQAARDTMGRGGIAMLSFMGDGPEKMHQLAEEYGAFGAKVEEEDAAIGEAWQHYSTQFDAMWEGIKTALAKPILQFLADHIDQIMPKISALEESLADGIGGAMKYIEPLAQTAWGVLSSLADVIGEELVPWFKTLLPLIEAVGEALKLMADGAGMALGAVATVMHHVRGDEVGASAAWGREQEAMHRVRQDMGLEAMPITVHNHFGVDPEKIGDTVGKKTGASVTIALAEHTKKIAGHHMQHKIAQAFGGRR